MSKRSKILELLTQNDLTTKEIQEKLGYKLDLIQVYINQFKEAGKIKKAGNKGKFFLYSTVKKEFNTDIEYKKYLKQLYDFMSNYMTIREDKKEEVKQNRDLIVKIKELII